MTSNISVHVTWKIVHYLHITFSHHSEHLYQHAVTLHSSACSSTKINPPSHSHSKRRIQSSKTKSSILYILPILLGPSSFYCSLGFFSLKSNTLWVAYYYYPRQASRLLGLKRCEFFTCLFSFAPPPLTWTHLHTSMTQLAGPELDIWYSLTSGNSSSSSPSPAADRLNNIFSLL